MAAMLRNHATSASASTSVHPTAAIWTLLAAALLVLLLLFPLLLLLLLLPMTGGSLRATTATARA